MCRLQGPLADVADAGAGCAQVWDIPLIEIEKCSGGCPGDAAAVGQDDHCPPPLGRPGNVYYGYYGPNDVACPVRATRRSNAPRR